MPAIGIKTERKIWLSGISTIDDFILSPPSFISDNRRNKIIDQIFISKENLELKNSDYFYSSLPSNEHWRIFKEFQHNTAFIDIETTGLSFYNNIITTIALYDGQSIRYYINGHNLDSFIEDIMSYSLIITYNGKAFDIPFIENYFGLRISKPQIDLRYILCSLGYSGGLKACERKLGIGRNGILKDIDGFMAVLLWKDYKKYNNTRSLETLLSYNMEDSVNLEYLMVQAYNMKLAGIPLKTDCIKIPESPDIPFQVDTPTVNRLNLKMPGY